MEVQVHPRDGGGGQVDLLAVELSCAGAAGSRTSLTGSTSMPPDPQAGS